jgi:hypothetical protein
VQGHLDAVQGHLDAVQGHLEVLGGGGVMNLIGQETGTAVSAMLRITPTT